MGIHSRARPTIASLLVFIDILFDSYIFISNILLSNNMHKFYVCLQALEVLSSYCTLHRNISKNFLVCFITIQNFNNFQITKMPVPLKTNLMYFHLDFLANQLASESDEYIERYHQIDGPLVVVDIFKFINK